MHSTIAAPGYTEGPGPDFPHMHARKHTLYTLAAPCLIAESTMPSFSPQIPLSISLAPRHGSTALIFHKSKTTQKPLPVYCSQKNTVILFLKVKNLRPARSTESANLL